jgi:NRE family putative nickel resistance protein-like MFS transporter
MILVNTIGHIKNGLLLDDKYYGWLMAVFGIGAAISAFILGSLDKSKTRSLSLISGAALLGLAISFANFVPYTALLFLWMLAGLGQSLAEMPSETLIAETIASPDQGKVYGSHFAFSHLWWAIAYPIAGFLGSHFSSREFLYGGIATLILSIIAVIIFKPSLNFDNK